MMPLPRPSGGSPRGHPAHGGKTPVSTLDEAADPATPAIAFLVARVAGVGSCSACWRWDALFRDPSHSRCPRPASFASTQGGAAPGNAGNGSLHPSPQRKNTGRVSPRSLPPLPVRACRFCRAPVEAAAAAVAGPGLAASRALALRLPPVPLRPCLSALPCVAAVACAGVGATAGAGAAAVRCLRRPGSHGGGSSCRCRGPALPRSPGASVVAAGSPASSHRCSCPSPWARPLVRRAWWLLLLFLPACQHTETAPAPATKATVLRNPLQKKKTQEKPAETRCHRCRCGCRVLPLLSAVRLLLRSAALPCGCRVLPRCAAPRSRRHCCCPAAHAAAVAGGEVANFKVTGSP